MDAVTLWNRACGQLKTVLNEDTYSRWIDILKPVGFETDILTTSEKEAVLARLAAMLG